MATKKPAEQITARVLLDCALGKCDDVVTVDAATAAQYAGAFDADPSAVAYALTLAKK